MFRLRAAFHNLQRDYEAADGVYRYTYPEVYTTISSITHTIQRVRKERGEAIVAQTTTPKVHRSARMKPVCIILLSLS